MASTVIMAIGLSVQILGARVTWVGGGRGERGKREGGNTAGVPHDNLQGEHRLIFQKTLLSCAVQPRCQFAYGLSASGADYLEALQISQLRSQILCHTEEHSRLYM